MGRAQTGRAGLRHVIVRDPPRQEASGWDIPRDEWSESDGRLSPGERWLGAVLGGPEWSPVYIRERTWEASPSAVKRARELTWAAIADWNLLELTDAAVLCVSELATNAVLHAAMPDQRVSALWRTFTVRLSFWPRSAVAIEVVDADPRPPVPADRSVIEPSSSAPDRIGGSSRGLLMVEAVSDFVSWAPVATGGKTVWCRFDLAPRGPARPFTMSGRPKPADAATTE